MKTIFLPLLLAVGLVFVSCGKQQSDADRQAEIDRQVQQRLDAEHQAETQRNLDQRQSDLDAREQALADKKDQPAATPAPVVAEATPARDTSAQPNDAEDDSYSTFYRKLDPYGDWIETSSYGYVFQPRSAVGDSGWRPYTDGHWVYTDAGWTWISAEPFGWATCHYGRWARLRGVGWVWVPGNEWAPAWVSWRRGNDYVGWAPLPPEARFDRQSGLRDFSDNRYGIAPEQYAFVPVKEFGGPQSARVIVPPARNITIINQTKNVTNITYNNNIVVDRGPSYDDLRGRSQHKIPRLRLERSKNVNAEKPVIRGDVVAMAVRDFRPAQNNARPPRVQRKLTQPTVENPPPNVRGSPPAQPTRPKMPEKATPATTTPPARKPVRPTVSAPPAATVMPTRKPVRPAASAPPATATPTATPAPRATLPPTATPASTATPPPTATPQSTLNPRQEARRQHMIEQRKERREQRKNAPAPSPTAESSATPSDSATATSTPSVLPRQGRRVGPQPNQP